MLEGCKTSVVKSSEMASKPCVVQYEGKIKQLLEKLLDPTFVVTTDTYLNSVLSHLSGKDDKEVGDALLDLPIFIEWLMTSTQYWEDTGTIPSQNIIGFIINFTSLLSKNENRFNRLETCNVYLRMCAVLKIRTKSSSPTVKLSYIKLLLSFLEHQSGVDWIIVNDTWQDVLEYCLEGSTTTYVMREGHNFLYSLLIKCCKINLVFCNKVIEKIMSNINKLSLRNGVVSDEILQERLTSTLRILAYIFATFLQNNLASKDYTIPKIFLTTYNLKQTIDDIFKITGQSEGFFMDLSNITVLNIFFHLAIDLESERFQCNRLKKLMSEIRKLIGSNISKGFVTNICHLCHLSQYYWKLMESYLPNVDFNSVEVLILFESQMVLYEVFPSFMLPYKGSYLQVPDDNFQFDFIKRAFKSLCVDSVKLAHDYRDLLMREDVNLFEAALKATAYIMKTRKYYHRNTGVLAFQYYIYTLNDLLLIMKANQGVAEKFANYTSYFIAVFDLIITFIKDFDITWKESVETISLMHLAVEFISLTRWSPKMIVQAFKLIDLTIARYMPCNLALLVEGSSELTSMSKLGPLLQTYLKDQEWEVRDSALEILHTISEISVEMYPSFRNDILNFEFPSLIVTMVMEDSDRYVRATAIKCLQEMVKVLIFWNSTLENENLSEKMMTIIYDVDEDANVRCEATTLLSLLYEYRPVPNLQERINQAMAHAAIKDYDWEVRERALDYWKKVIDQHLSNQGMIDKVFPNYTFSQGRRIVTLTEAGIRNRLNTVLEELSRCGCLGVLATSMQDKCDIQVLKKAVEISKHLKDLLVLYKVINNTETEVSSTVNLVNNVNEYSVTNGDDDCSRIVLVPENNIVLPKDFLSFIQRDLDKMIVERTTWNDQIDNLDSLLDDILKCYDNDINVLDCY